VAPESDISCAETSYLNLLAGADPFCARLRENQSRNFQPLIIRIEDLYRFAIE
jgi:hypothetical protein